MNTGRLSYGGKVGVWISHKRKKREVPHRNRKNPSSSALLSQYSHHSMMFRRAVSHLSYNGGSNDPLVGWDEVKCRPVYYNNSSPQQQMERNDDKHEEMDDEHEKNDKEKEQLDVLSWEKSRVKKSYGSQITNRHRRGRLSSLANAVLENVASPSIVPSFPGTKKCSSGSSSSSTVPLNADDDDDDADGSHSEDNLNNFSILAMYEHDISSDDDCKTSSNDKNKLPFTSELQFEILNESTTHHGTNSTRNKRKICIQPQTDQVKSSSKHSKKIKNEHEHQQTKIKTIRQPTHSSSLEEAKAFFDQLDREELKIVSTDE